MVRKCRSAAKSISKTIRKLWNPCLHELLSWINLNVHDKISLECGNKVFEPFENIFEAWI